MHIKEANILICDDSVLACKKLADSMQEIGNDNCTQVCNGNEALEEIKKGIYDICFMDLCMPLMDGMSVLREIAGMKNKPYIIIVSSLCTKSTMMEALGYGAKDFIQKPFTQNQMVSVISTWMKKVNKS